MTWVFTTWVCAAPLISRIEEGVFFFFSHILQLLCVALQADSLCWRIPEVCCTGLVAGRNCLRAFCGLRMPEEWESVLNYADAAVRAAAFSQEAIVSRVEWEAGGEEGLLSEAALSRIA